jgi:hypothetical protein
MRFPQVALAGGFSGLWLVLRMPYMSAQADKPQALA